MAYLHASVPVLESAEFVRPSTRTVRDMLEVTVFWVRDAGRSAGLYSFTMGHARNWTLSGQ